jgi:hypothetical protein
MSEASPPSPSSPKKETKSLTEIFNKFAADAVERFPQLKGQLLVADMNERKSYGHNEIDQKKTGLTPETAREYLRDHQITKAMEKDKNMSSLAMRDDRQKVNIIFINDAVAGAEAANVSKATEEHLLFVLDHELAHCGVKDGFARAAGPRDYAILLAESVTDAYALIRHYQRFGVDNDSHDKYVSPGARADNFVMWGDSTHFTSFVLDAVAKRKHLIDFDKLTPEQTADLARRFALEFMPPKRVVEDLAWTFSAIKTEFKKDPNSGVKALVDKALDPASDYYTFKMASMWLKPLLDDRTFMDGKPVGLPKDYLDNAAAKLKERTEKFEKEDILFGMPIKPQAKQPPKFAA